MKINHKPFLMLVLSLASNIAFADAQRSLSLIKSDLASSISELSLELSPSALAPAFTDFRQARKALQKNLEQRITDKERFLLAKTKRYQQETDQETKMRVSIQPLSGKRLGCDEVETRYSEIKEIWLEIDTTLDELSSAESSSDETELDFLSEIHNRLEALKAQLANLDAADLEKERVKQTYSVRLKIPPNTVAYRDPGTPYFVRDIVTPTFHHFDWNGMQHVRDGAFAPPASFDIGAGFLSTFEITRSTSYVNACLYEKNLSIAADLEVNIQYQHTGYAYSCDEGAFPSIGIYDGLSLPDSTEDYPEIPVFEINTSPERPGIIHFDPDYLDDTDNPPGLIDLEDLPGIPDLATCSRVLKTENIVTKANISISATTED